MVWDLSKPNPNHGDGTRLESPLYWRADGKYGFSKRQRKLFMLHLQRLKKNKKAKTYLLFNLDEVKT